MTTVFEAFKKYHNANYYDGDNTFDDAVYKKSNGEDFDNEFVQDCFDHFEAAWQKQQKRIDKLESVVTDLRKNLKDRELAVFVRQERIESLESMLFN